MEGKTTRNPQQPTTNTRRKRAGRERTRWGARKRGLEDEAKTRRWAGAEKDATSQDEQDEQADEADETSCIPTSTSSVVTPCICGSTVQLASSLIYASARCRSTVNRQPDSRKTVDVLHACPAKQGLILTPLTGNENQTRTCRAGHLSF